MSDFPCSFSYGSKDLFELHVMNFKGDTHGHIHQDENFPSTTHTQHNMQIDTFRGF